MHPVQGQMENQWRASTGHLNCSLESTARPALPTHVWASTAECCAYVLRASSWNATLCSHDLGIQHGNGSECPVKNRLFQSRAQSLPQDLQTQLIQERMK